jgi:hypothetical protein
MPECQSDFSSGAVIDQTFGLVANLQAFGTNQPNQTKPPSNKGKGQGINWNTTSSVATLFTDDDIFNHISAAYNPDGFLTLPQTSTKNQLTTNKPKFR